MVDEKKNDEYELSDNDLLSDVGASAVVPDDALEPSVKPATTIPLQAPGSVTHRNALIVIGILVLLFVVYEIYSYLTAKPTVPVRLPPAVSKPAPASSQPTLPPVQAVAVPAAPVLNDQMRQRIDSLSTMGEGLRGNVTQLSDQMIDVQGKVQAISDRFNALNLTITELTAKLDAQTKQMQLLEVKVAQLLTPKPKVRLRALVPKTKYHVQALIPGRAWLITDDDAHTITVRVGSEVPGYGLVQMIDPNRGRVFTSSGRVIKFSKQES